MSREAIDLFLPGNPGNACQHRGKAIEWAGHIADPPHARSMSVFEQWPEELENE
jgi:hypothetical protein